jgi:hypothetical protein
LPTTWITYVPDGALAIWKLPLGEPVPATITQPGIVTGDGVEGLLIEQEVSSDLKPEPVTKTVDPTGPEVGVSTIVGPLDTVNVASAKSFELPVTRTT